MADNDDDLDYTGHYNTQLSERDERQFQDWLTRQSEHTRRDVSRDLYDYDLRGYWRRHRTADLSEAHLPDTYKKPNHPTFSDESQYHGVEGLHGGRWTRRADNTWSFTPGRTNMTLYGPNRLRRYFERVEPGNEVVVPPRTIATDDQPY